ncbi:MBL fold metallo-hydrolase [candidate division KSB1 bacterium]|nr:MBL fold metallo-hydrolase [candidate division KSB1 bacterium]
MAIFGFAAGSSAKSGSLQTDTLASNNGNLEMTFVGHGSLMFKCQDKIIHIDPVSREGDYSKLPKADLILVTHEHGDHLDTDLIEQLRKPGTVIIVSASCANRVPGAIIMKNGDNRDVLGMNIKAVPAYNIIHMRSENNPYHPKGNGNGYIIRCGDKNIYVAGDTENTPEMKALTHIDVAFLPMNLPYTMTPEMVADAAKAFKPAILYPYHYGNTDTQKLLELLKSEKQIEVRIRDLQ